MILVSAFKRRSSMEILDEASEEKVEIKQLQINGQQLFCFQPCSQRNQTHWLQLMRGGRRGSQFPNSEVTRQSYNHLRRRSTIPSIGDGLRRSNSTVCRKREVRLTRISLAIVWLFLFCHFWKFIPSIYELAYRDEQEFPAWVKNIQHVSHVLIVLNSSVNFLIYVAL